ncbi:helix-turn-helix domain-containing protein [Coraliomargarita sp. SDUM461003]|uniref:Helix-turn-helix domain-containing protein n=1 Tax=Thalassobacterium maritimum TaxID=3041265 RepID=A0ABU1AWQ5_9BACT|nr:helix-turn-helix domain-containing protein [Coraliomargarita sp. SDUM461003]MDQ8208590.1 helix-turn-helix domain-containing protein [Coraliomargarita sp. SDUM461003]
MLAHALDILRLLSESPDPLSATEISQKVGLHTSNVSRTLRVLIDAGYVRKPSYHSFAPDLGLLALAGSAARHHPLCIHSAAAIKSLSTQLELQTSLAGLFREQIIYLQRCAPGGEPVQAGTMKFPLHLSVVALRLLLELPQAKAIDALEASKRRYGWERPTSKVPASPKECLQAASDALQDDVLRLDAWNAPNSRQMARLLTVPQQPLLALACDGNKFRIPAAMKHLNETANQLITTLTSLS